MDRSSVESFSNLVSCFSFAQTSSVQYRCELCSEKFTYLESLVSHRTFKHDNGDIRCMRCYSVCDELFCAEMSKDNLGKVCKICYDQLCVGDRWEDIMSRFLDKEPWIKKHLVGANEPLSSIFRGCPILEDADMRKWSTMRPDKLYIIEYEDCVNCVWVECDENQHSQYDKVHEGERMAMGQKIINDYFASKTVRFLIIRWNPDKCMGIGNKHTIDKRLEALVDAIAPGFSGPLTSTRELIYLYYDICRNVQADQ